MAKERNKNTGKNRGAQVEDQTETNENGDGGTATATEGTGKRKIEREKNVIKDPETGEEYDLVNKPEAIPTWLQSFYALDLNYDGKGYFKYVTNSGFSNPDCPRKMPTKAHLMLILQSMHVLAERSVGGSDEATSAMNVVLKYGKQAGETGRITAAKRKIQELVNMGVTVKPGAIEIEGVDDETLAKLVEEAESSKKGSKGKKAHA